ncbi:DNA/RNA non-specific endonuclease [Agromyces seonyuensis]|uniref:DNA/RNA non-specific endonuclease n=1 Tax=Agromyces seonyuensis TaxID=2662446 RepID=A0A6I4P6Z4_9MICO|nr:DNA/RNA non-specific endonuclease [Agromyces seonyuensis]MWB99474.1 DNA/RNA non-specific endonuclease [Agromyces seonyuensis]
MTGFDAAFLDDPTPLPTFDAAAQADALDAGGSDWLDYAHFSLSMSVERRMARVVAWNIDGADLDGRIGREGERFHPDPRIPASAQLLNDLYAGNDLDRGHVARRADLLWGEDAAQANTDSFCFTNITPQMNDFNQASRGGLWGRLEEDLLAEAQLGRQRISLFGGPVFGDDDPRYRDVAIPTAFWKLFAYDFDGVPSAQAFVLAQSLDRLGEGLLPLRGWDTFAIGFDELADRTGVRFDAIAGWEVRPDELGIRADREPLDRVVWG